MKAALLVEPGRTVIDDVPEPEVGPDDVRIAVGGVGLCGSDLSVFSGKWTPPHYPWIQGHEAFGTVESVGERVATARVGEIVVIEPNITCMSCVQCRRGRSSACPQRSSVGMNRPGALAEKLVVPSEYAWSIEGTAADLVCVEPLTVSETALRRLGDGLPASALVVGVGAQGMLMCLALIRRGVSVHALDVNPERVAFATRIGAHAFATGGDGPSFDLVVDTVGTPGSIATALRHIEIGGTLLVLGLDGTPFELSAQTLVRRQLVLRGSLTYDHPDDFRATVKLVRERLVSPGRIVSDEYPFEEAQRAFESCAAAPGKTWIRVAPASTLA